MSLQTELTAARKASGLTQQQLADKAGLNRNTVLRTETAEFDPRISTVVEMARALGMDVMLVPTILRQDLENFVRSGGRFLGQPAGSDAPPSIIDTITSR